ncbi:MAG: hypothetical protein QM535_17605 [Limnohabitans sp.]|nr:hypothetical protein [Limnohabitans sp.]
MEPIHKLSSITPLTEFDLWGVPPTQLTVEKILEAEYRPVATVDSSSPITFQFTTAIDEYLKINDIFLSFTVNLNFTKANEITQTESEKLYFKNYTLHSMIKQIDFEINGKQISYLPQNYPYRAFIEAFLGFSKSAKDSHLGTAFWNEDGKTSIETTDISYKKSKNYHMMGKIHTDFSFQGRYLLGGCNIKIEFVLNNPKFYLQLPDGISATLNLSDVTLHIQKAKITPDSLNAHRKAFSISPAKYPYTRIEIKHVVVPKDVNDIWIDNLIFGQIPRRMFVFLVENDAFNGAYNKDPYDFKDFNLNYICAFVDGHPYPNQPYTPDFENKKYLREYLGLFQTLNELNTDPYLNLSFENYKNDKYIIYGFNFANDYSDGFGIDGHSNLIKRGTLRLQLKFKSPLTIPINVVAYCEFDNIIEINIIGEVYSNSNV